MAKKKIVKDKKGNPVEIDQDAINAALAGAVTMRDGSPLAQTPPVDEIELEGKKAETTSKKEAASEPIAADQKKFVEDCYNFNIDAKKCHYQSAKHEDKTILEYIRAINKKIYDETRVGGFSTNVQFRVAPHDWVNVSHIKDWYVARGFVVEDKGTTAPAFGKDVGSMNYNFTISWATAQ